MTNDFVSCLEYIKECMGCEFPKCVPYEHIELEQARFFRLDYRFLINLNSGINAEICPYFEVHASRFIRNIGNVFQGKMGFYISCNPHLINYFVLPKLSYFKIEYDEIFKMMDFRFNYPNEEKYPVIETIVVLNNQLDEVIGLFVHSIKQLLSNEKFLDYIETINDTELKKVTRNQILLLIGYDISQKMSEKVNEYANNNVLNYSHEKKDNYEILIGNIKGNYGKIYKTIVKFNGSSILEHQCDCMAHQKYSGPCKHVLALLQNYAFSLWY